MGVKRDLHGEPQREQSKLVPEGPQWVLRWSHAGQLGLWSCHVRSAWMVSYTILDCSWKRVVTQAKDIIL